MSKPLAVDVQEGRRTHAAPLAPEEKWVVGRVAAAPARPIADVRRIARQRQGPAVDLGDQGGLIGAGGGGGQGGGGLFQLGFGGGVVAFQPIVQVFPTGSFITTQAVVSADRRYVRMNIVPVIQRLAPGPITIIPVGGTAGGGGFFGGGS
jgi:hypothetical protein